MLSDENQLRNAKELHKVTNPSANPALPTGKDCSI
jgi:hypothetical protein